MRRRIVADVPAAEAESTPTVMAAEGTSMTGDTVASAVVTTVEIVLVGGRMLRASASLPTSELRRLISAVEGA